MLQDMNKTVETQKQVWLKNTLATKFTKVIDDPVQFQEKFEKDGYEIKQVGMEFFLMHGAEIVSRFKPSINFSTN